jgi:DNA-binding IclR family transcriptional regulator
MLFLKENNQAKVSDLVNIIELSDGRVRALLREMVKDGTIEKIGESRYTHYVLKI